MNEQHIERFWAKVARAGDDACWPWIGGTDRYGYGRYGGKRTTLGERWIAHRFAWAVTNGCIPAKTKVLHSCDNPPCCNPRHLFLGSQSDNMADMHSKRRHRCRQTGKTPGLWHPKTKLTEQLVREMRQDFAMGVSYRDLASHFGIAIRTAELIVKRKTWGHVI